jgi:hypothetical protein
MQIVSIINNLTLKHTDKTFRERLSIAIPLIFNFDYPIWNEQYRETLERKILMHYLNKEICSETFYMWQIYMEERLNLIMPYYNQLYESILKYDIAKSHNITETENSTKNDETNIINTNVGKNTNNNTVEINGTNTNNLTGSDIDCDTPQARLNGGDYASNITETNRNNVDTIDNTTTNNTVLDITNTNNGNSTTNATNNITKNSSGNNVPISDLIMKHRETILNIDRLIIEQLYDLFILIN